MAATTARPHLRGLNPGVVRSNVPCRDAQAVLSAARLALSRASVGRNIPHRVIASPSVWSTRLCRAAKRPSAYHSSGGYALTSARHGSPLMGPNPTCLARAVSVRRLPSRCRAVAAAQTAFPASRPCPRQQPPSRAKLKRPRRHCQLARSP